MLLNRFSHGINPPSAAPTPASIWVHGYRGARGRRRRGGEKAGKGERERRDEGEEKGEREGEKRGGSKGEQVRTNAHGERTTEGVG
jgi:hypothetical protein